MLKQLKEPLIDFVRGGAAAQTCASKYKAKKSKELNLDGEEIKSFYESVISEESTCIAPDIPKVKENTTRSHGSDDLDCQDKNELHVKRSKRWCKKYVNKLLRAAQEGDASVVSQFLKDGMDIDVQDQYGWTALMCSSYSGHVEIVKLLLRQGAMRDICDNRGETAKDLAKNSGHSNIVTLINDFVEEREDNDSTSESTSGFYCEVCDCHFYHENDKSHSTSTLHLFNLKVKPKEPEYLIAASNVGYQMMLRSGWKESCGLGPGGKGRKFPVKTVLKQNRKGLGQGESSPRVTHFKPNDTNAVKSSAKNPERVVSVRTLSRRAMRKKELKDKEWERRLRTYMNSE